MHSSLNLNGVMYVIQVTKDLTTQIACVCTANMQHAKNGLNRTLIMHACNIH